MRSLNSIFFTAALAAFLSVSCAAGGTQGETPFNFLFLDANARPAALGGSYAALSRDVNALQYNPAGLGFLNGHGVTFMHNQHFQDIAQEYFAFVWKIGKDSDTHKNNQDLANKGNPRLSHGWGFAINSLNYGGIKRTTLSNPDGAEPGRVEARDFSMAAGYGRAVSKSIACGFSVKFIQEIMDDINIQSWGFDAGLLVKPEIPVSFGLAVQNMGPRIKSDVESFELPFNIRGGLAWYFSKNGVITAETDVPKAGKLTTHTGIEYSFFKIAALRAGYNGRNETASGLTFGGGLRLADFSIDYALISYGALGDSNRLSLTYGF